VVREQGQTGIDFVSRYVFGKVQLSSVNQMLFNGKSIFRKLDIRFAV